jgi:hypothetical protein
VTAKQRAFLVAFGKSGIIGEAARKAKIGRQSHYDWLSDPVYANAFEQAREESIELLEKSVRQRAMRARKPSDLLSIFLLKAARPEKYRDNAKVEMSGPGGGPVVVEVKFVTPKPKS